MTGRISSSVLFDVMRLAVVAFLYGGITYLHAAEQAGERKDHRSRVIVVVGAEGTPEYGAEFALWRTDWQDAAERWDFELTVVAAPASEGGETDTCDQRQLVLDAVADAVEQTPARLWIVLVGHGTFDGRTARLNLCGADLTAAELRDALADRDSSGDGNDETVIFNCTAASAPFINVLSQPGRVVVTATKSGREIQFSRFGKFLAEAAKDDRSDLDRDGALSALELAVEASRRTQAWYAEEGRIAAEHALIDDNGDQRGTRADTYDGVRPAPSETPEKPIDGQIARGALLAGSPQEALLTPDQVARRRMLESRVDVIRARRSDPPDDATLDELEAIFVELASFYLPESEIPEETREVAGE